MRKYLQIIVVLTAFFAVVLVKNLRSEDEERPIILSVPPISPTAIPTHPSSPTPLTQGSTPPPSIPTATLVPQIAKGQYRNGDYTGSVEDAFYGPVQVKAIISGGKITDIQLLQYPNDNRTSISINSQAMPILRDEAIQAQSASIDMVSGASNSSPAFIKSLNSALAQAKQI